MAKTASSIGANTFQFFTRNPRGGASKPINVEDIAAFRNFSKENGIDIIMAHAPYTLNACAEKESVRRFAFDILSDDMQRMEYLPGNLYNMHPGSHVGQGTEIGISKIADVLNEIIWPEMHTTILLETMAGKGSEIGRRFEEIADIISKCRYQEKIGVCLDTCHVYDAGYDIAEKLEEVLENFEHIIGLDRLKAIHVNSSKNPFESHKDRHEVLGKGFINIDVISRIITHQKLKDLPFILETPNELPGYAKEIAMIKEIYKNSIC